MRATEDDTRRRDSGIKACMDAMLSANWRPGKSHQELAERFGVEVITVRGWAAEAARFLRMCRGNEEEFRERMLAELDEIAVRCRDNQRTWPTKDGGERTYDAPDYRNWIAALELRARIHGLAQQTQPGQASGAPMEVPVEELKAALEQAGYRIEKVSDGSSRKDREKG